jgi:hypothetical protein
VNWVLLAGSLAGVLALAGAARLLGLGAEARIADEDDTIRIAKEHGFEGTIAQVQDHGREAIVADRYGHVLGIRAHGVHFVTERRA